MAPAQLSRQRRDNLRVAKSLGKLHHAPQVLLRESASIVGLERTGEIGLRYPGVRNLLREEGILILGSGNIVHNLALADFSADAYDWAQSFDQKVGAWILAGDHQPIIRWREQGQEAELSVNSAEHYKPLLYVLGLQRENETVSFFAESLVAGSLSMRSVRIG